LNPSETSSHQQALDLLSAGDWDAAHQIVQDETDALACLIHAHLHKIEGDLANAGYWYQQAGESLAELSVRDEFAELQRRLS